jgi:hypothetical protein
MEIIVLILLVCITGLFGAYTLNFQRTILSVRRKLASDNVLIPIGKTARNLILPLLISVILIYSLIFFRWYLAFVFTIVAFSLVIAISKTFMPKPESNFYLNKIRRNLERKRETYRRRNDGLREAVMILSIRSFDSLLKEQKRGEPV